MRRRLRAILVLTALVASALAGCDQNSPSASTLNILSITEGTVFVMKAGTGDWIEAGIGMSLEAGDSIRTDDSSSAEITFSDGSTIELQAGTAIEIASLDICADTGSTTIVLEQTIGNLIFRVAKIVDPASRYEVETPTGVVAVRGSAMQVYVIQDGTTRATNLEGDIWASAQGVELQVPEGRQCIIRPGEPPQLLPHEYFLTVTSTDGGSVTVPSGGDGTYIYDAGDVAALVAEADEGYQFVNWTGDVDTVGDVYAARTSITMNGDYSVTANFEEVAQYDLTTSSTIGGSVTVPGEGTFTYSDGTVVNLVATANSGYYFINWTGDVGTIANVNAPTTTVTTNDSCSITANFEQIPPGKVALTTSSTAGGSVTTPGEGAFLYNVGEVVSLVSSPAGRCRFVNWTGDVGTVANVNAASTSITMNGDYALMANFDVTPMVAAGEGFTVGLKSDGTVVTAGFANLGQCGDWTDITQAAAGFFHTVGLKFDGTVVATGDCASGQCNVGSWTNITQVTAGEEHTVGLKSDGTVVAVGEGLFFDYGQSNVGGWTDIIQIAAGEFQTVGLKPDGTVVAVGRNRYGEGDVDDCTDITQIATGPSYGHTVGLKTDGTVVAVGLNNDGQCDVDGWTDIVQVSVGGYHTVGLKSDGTVVATGDNRYGQCDVGGWTGIIQVSAGYRHTVGLKADGTVVATGSNYDGQCDVGDWDLN